MSSVIQSTYYPLWAAHPVMQAGLAGLIWKRKLLRTYPIFFSYLVFEILLFLVLFATRSNYVAYFYGYWIGCGISSLFGFAVIHEVFTDVLRPFHALRDLSSMLFRWAGLVVMLIAVAAAMGSTASGFPLVMAGLLSLERSVRVMQCGLVLFLLMFSRYLGISRRHRSFGIALGFSLFAVVELAVFGLRATAQINATVLSVASMSSYLLAVALWFGYFLAPAAEQKRAEVLLQPQRWDLSLGEVSHPVAPESLLPMFDAMVDRAFSKAGEEVNSAQAAPAKKETKTVEAAPEPANGSPAIAQAFAAAAHRTS